MKDWKIPKQKMYIPLVLAVIVMIRVCRVISDLLDIWSRWCARKIGLKMWEI